MVPRGERSSNAPDLLDNLQAWEVHFGFSLEGVIMLSTLTIVVISITVIIFGVKRIKSFVEVKKSRLFKDEVARYKKLKEQERQKKRISDEFSDEVKVYPPNVILGFTN